MRTMLGIFWSRKIWFFKLRNRETIYRGAYKDGPEIWVARPLFFYFVARPIFPPKICHQNFFLARPQKSVARPILARPLLQKNVLWPVLISAPVKMFRRKKDNFCPKTKDVINVWGVDFYLSYLYHAIGWIPVLSQFLALRYFLNFRHSSPFWKTHFQILQNFQFFVFEL